MRLIQNWYPLLEGTGLTARDMGPGNAYGTLTANCSWYPYYYPPGTLLGYKGVQIASSQSRIASAAATGFNPSEGSIEMLVKPLWDYTDINNPHFWSTYGGSNTRFELAKQTDGSTRLIVNSANKGSFVYPWANGSIYHVVLNWGTNVLYINGSLANNYTDGTLGVPSNNLYMGDYWSGVNYSFNGVIYYLIVRNVPLTQAEINLFYNFFINQYT